MKHSFEAEVQEALGEPGCAMCRLGGRTVSRYLDILAYENVNNVELRATIREAIGLCNRHVWQLLDGTRAPLGTAIIYRDLIRTLQQRTSGDVGREVGRPRKLRGLLPRGRCVACAALDEMIRDCAHQILHSWSDPSFRRAFEVSDGLCWPHFLATLDADRLARHWSDLLTTQRVAWDRRVSQARETGRPEILREALSSAPRLNGTQIAPDAVGPPLNEPVDAVPEMEVPPGHCAVCASVAAWRVAGEHSCPGPLLCAVHAWPPARPTSADDPETLGRQLTELSDRLLRAATADRRGLAVLRWAERYRRGSGVPPEVTAGPGCSMCAAQLRYEVGVVRSEESATFCVPHLRLAASQSDSFAAIHARTRQTWHDVEGQLDEYIRKHDYRFQHESRGDEQTSPRWAVALVAGAEGIR